MTDTAAGPGADVHHPAPDFINGALTRLRPVLERDLAGMVALMNEAPLGFTWEGFPWSVARLRKKFEDEKEPGLWGQRQRFLAATDLDGALVGVLHEEQERNGQVGLEFHFALACPERREMALDALGSYRSYRCDWYNTPRIEVNLLAPQQDEMRWLLELGFHHDMSCPRIKLYLGRPEALEIFSWCQPWVLANRASDGIGVQEH